jgi:hypothetical protein
MGSVSGSRIAIARSLIALVLTLAMPAQWEAFCGGWQSPQEAMACCHRASHDDGPSAAFTCCVAQEQSRHAQSPVTSVVAVPATHATPLLFAPRVLPICINSTRPARTAETRLLASVFLI